MSECMHEPYSIFYLPSLLRCPTFIQGKPKIINKLIECGAKLDTVNEVSPEYKGYTPLHRAFRWWLDPGKPNAISHLLSIGANPTLVDAQGRTPVDLVADSSCVAAVSVAAHSPNGPPGAPHMDPPPTAQKCDCGVLPSVHLMMVSLTSRLHCRLKRSPMLLLLGTILQSCPVKPKQRKVGCGMP